jgi:hypothetical protein
MVQLREGLPLDFGRALPRLPETRKRGDGFGPVVEEPAGGAPEGGLERLVGERLLRVPGEETGRRLQQACPVPAVPGAASAGRPARISARWTAFTGYPKREIMPSMFMRQPRSPEVTYAAPVARIRSTLCSVILQEICGYFTEKTPPKPQHRSLSSISTNSTPRMARNSVRGASTTPSPRRRWQESW